MFIVKVGRKPKYDFWVSDDGLILISGWTRRGLTKEQVAKNIGINEATLYDWIKLFPKLDKALKLTKDIADCLVESALFKNATGFMYEEENVVGSTVMKVKKFHKPDSIAQFFWLKNRRSADWNEKQPSVNSEEPDDPITASIRESFKSTQAESTAASDQAESTPAVPGTTALTTAGEGK